MSAKTFFVSIKKYIVLFLLGSRVKTWPLSLIPVAMSSALAFKDGFFEKELFFFTMISVLFIQIAVNLFNDAWDGKQGLDDSNRLGPLRLVGSGKMSFLEVRFLAFLSCLLAFVFAWPLILRGGLLILSMGFLSLLSAYFYTGSKYSLLKLGLSELACVLFFGFFIVFGTYYLQSLSFSVDLIYLSLQCGFWSLSLLLINHLRDEEKDRTEGRKHFVTLYGRTHSLFFLIVIQAFIYLFCFYWLGLELKAGAFSFFTVPFSVFLLYQLCQTPSSKKYNSYLAFASLYYMLFGSVWILGLLY